MKNTHLEHPEDSILTGDLSVLDWFAEQDSIISTKIDGGSSQGLNGKKKQIEQWMNSEMGKTSMRKYYHNSAGGNTHFKIVHNIVAEYNFWAEENAPTMTVAKDYLHQNGILDPNKMLTKEERRKLPSFPSDIKI